MVPCVMGGALCYGCGFMCGCGPLYEGGACVVTCMRVGLHVWVWFYV